MDGAERKVARREEDFGKKAEDADTGDIGGTLGLWDPCRGGLSPDYLRRGYKGLSKLAGVLQPPTPSLSLPRLEHHREGHSKKDKMKTTG